MRLTKLSLRNFRNISELQFEPGPILNLITGDNAQGKTSILESIYFLSALKSFRTPRYCDLISFNQEAGAIEAQIQSRSSTEVILKTKLFQKQKSLLIDEKASTSSKFRQKLRTVAFSPESLEAIKSGPDQRRNLVDEAIFQMSEPAAEAQLTFSRSLRQRNAVLKQAKAGITNLGDTQGILKSLEPGFIDWASRVTYFRLKFLREIQPIVQQILSTILGEEIGFRFDYQSHDKQWQELELDEIKSRITQELRDAQKAVAELALGVTLSGPHRHSINFVFNENDSRIYCSQGQQRAVILSFKMAEIVYHGKVFNSFPLLLLDDVLSEFDENKRRFVIDFLRTNEAQTFITTTDKTQRLPGCSEFFISMGKLVSC